MAFIKDLYRDEIRDGWLVKSSIKKAWNKMLELWQEVDRICRKYKLNYWAYGGTLLGAVRHGGFIPWDTDIDFCMMRPEYNILCDAVEHEWNQENGVFKIYCKNFNVLKLGLSSTTMLLEKDFRKRDPNSCYGIMADIFPMDIAPDGTPEGDLAAAGIWELINSLADSNYFELKERTKTGEKLINDWQTIEHFHSLTEREQQKFYSDYIALLFNKSSAIFWIDHISKDYPFLQKEWFRETIYLPFESVQLPCPVDYEKELVAYYNDWHKFVCDRQFRMGDVYSSDIPYEEFFKRVNPELMFPPKEEVDENSSTQEKAST